MTDLQEIQDQVRGYVIDSFLKGTQAETFRNDDNLLLVLDSLQILRMVLHLESSFSIKVTDGELTPENLGSVAKIAAFVDRKRQTPVEVAR